MDPPETDQVRKAKATRQKQMVIDKYTGEFQDEDNDHMSQIQEETNLKSHIHRQYRSLGMLIKMVLCYNLSSFYIGYTLVYFNAIPYVDTHRIFKIHLEYGIGEGLFSGLIEFGAVFGAFSMRYIFKYFTRKQSYLLANAIASIAGLFILIPSMPSLLVGRFFQGFCVGLYSTITPLVVKQLIPVEASGMLGSFYMSSLILGSLIAYSLPVIIGGSPQNFYKFTFGFPLITVVIQSLLLLLVYRNETPKFLLLKGRIQQAKELIRKIYNEQFWDVVLSQKLSSFRKIYNPTKSRNEHVNEPNSKSEGEKKQKIESELPDIKTEKNKDQDKPDSDSGLQERRSSIAHQSQEILDEYDIKYFKEIPLARTLAFELEIFQQFTGVYVIALYGRELAKHSIPQIYSYLPIILNGLRLVASICGIFIINKFGRKRPMLIGTLLISISLIGFCVGFTQQTQVDEWSFLKVLVALSFVLFTFFYSCTLGPITYLYIPEIIQPPTIPFTTMVSWLCAYLMIFLFPIVRAEEEENHDHGGNDGIGLFIFFTVCTVIHLLILWRLMIQTKYRGEQQIRTQFQKLKPCNCLPNSHQGSQNQIPPQNNNRQLKQNKQ